MYYTVFPLRTHGLNYPHISIVRWYGILSHIFHPTIVNRAQCERPTSCVHNGLVNLASYNKNMNGSVEVSVDTGRTEALFILYHNVTYESEM